MKKLTQENGNIALLLPGLLLLLLGLAVVRFPQLAIALMSALLIFFGVMVLSLGWKFYKLKQALDKTMKEASQARPGATFQRIDEDTIEILDPDVQVVSEDEGTTQKTIRVTYH